MAEPHKCSDHEQLITIETNKNGRTVETLQCQKCFKKREKAPY